MFSTTVIVKTSEKEYRLSEKDRLAIIKSKPEPSIFDVVEKKREDFKALYGDYFGQHYTEMLGLRR